jgi:hypothetical protein
VLSNTAANTVAGAVKSGTASKTGGALKTGAATRTGSVAKTGAVTKSGSVTLTGNSVANTLIGDAILVDVVGRTDNTPLVAISFLMAKYSAYIGAMEQIGNFPDGYVLNGAITESKSVLYWINRIAFEFRSFFKFQAGSAKLIVRPDSFTSRKTITKAQINNFSRSKTAYEDIINTVSLRYNRDYSKSKSSTAYKSLAAGTDSASVTKYGELEKAENFFCDFITDATLAGSVRDFYLTWYATRHWIYSLECFLDQIELEFGDQVATELRVGSIGMIRESGISPGNNDMDRVNLKIEL